MASVERVPLWPEGAVPTPGAAHTHAQLLELMRDDPLYESHLRGWFEAGRDGGWIDGAAETPDLELYPLPPRRGGGARALVLVFPGGGNVCRVDGVGLTTGEEREGPPVARWLNGLGFVAAVVHYRVQHRYPSRRLVG